jgi:hypothetical protein
MHRAFTGLAMFSVSPGGVLAYQEAAPLPGARIVWRDRTGKQLRSVEAPPGKFRVPKVTPFEGADKLVAR